VHAFFALPTIQKLAASHSAIGTNRGYHPEGSETLAAAHQAMQCMLERALTLLVIAHP
jgi:hypothetical protein